IRANDPSGVREGRPRVAILGALACSARLHFAVTRRSGGGELVDQSTGGRRDFVDGTLEDGFIGARRSARAAQFTDELDCRGADLLVTGRAIEIGQGSDASGHPGLRAV